LRFGAHCALALIALWRSLRFGAHCALALIALWRSLRFGAHRALALTNIIVVKLENRSYDIVLGWVYNPSNEPPHNQAPPGQINLKGLTGNETNPPTQQGWRTDSGDESKKDHRRKTGTVYPGTTVPIYDPPFATKYNVQR